MLLCQLVAWPRCRMVQQSLQAAMLPAQSHEGIA
jgi:hypothetical protein